MVGCGLAGGEWEGWERLGVIGKVWYTFSFLQRTRLRAGSSVIERRHTQAGGRWEATPFRFNSSLARRFFVSHIIFTREQSSFPL